MSWTQIKFNKKLRSLAYIAFICTQIAFICTQIAFIWTQIAFILWTQLFCYERKCTQFAYIAFTCVHFAFTSRKTGIAYKLRSWTQLNAIVRNCTQCTQNLRTFAFTIKISSMNAICVHMNAICVHCVHVNAICVHKLRTLRSWKCRERKMYAMYAIFNLHNRYKLTPHSITFNYPINHRHKWWELP